MAFIYIKGRKPEKVTRNLGEQIKQIFEDDNVEWSRVIGFRNFSIRKEDIRSVVLRDEEDAQKEAVDSGKKMIERIGIDHQKNVDALLKMPAKERAKNTEYFAMFFVALTEQQPTDDERRAAVKAQEDFFILKNIAIADPAIFVPIVKESCKGRDLGMFSAVLFEIVKRVYLNTRDRVPSWEYARQKSLLHKL